MKLTSKSEGKDLLKNYDNWVEANRPKQFSLFDYLHALSREGKIESDSLLVLLSVLWPNFYVYRGKVFLAEEFSQERYNTIENNPGDMGIEYWINLLPLSELFPFLDLSAQEFIGGKIVEMWSAKLKLEFPKLEFNVWCGEDEPSDLWCSFYQTTKTV